MYAYISKSNNAVMSAGNSIAYSNNELYSVEYDIQVWNDPEDALLFTYDKGAFVRNILTSNSRLKIDKEDKVRMIIVTTSTGKVFDGDEKSQDRLTRAIAIAKITGELVTEWKLADNSIAIVTLSELEEALALAGKAMATIWLGALF